MKVLILTPWFPADPQDQSGNFVLDSVKALHEEGVELSVNVIQPWIPKIAGIAHEDWGRKRLDIGNHESYLNLEHHRYISFPRNYLRSLSTRFMLHKMVPYLASKIKNDKYDVILAHTELIGLLALAIRKVANIPVVVFVHGINTAKRLQTESYQTLLKNVLENANAVIFVGEPLLNHFGSYVTDKSHLHVIHNGFRFPDEIPEKPVCKPENGIRFISVSNLHEGKGVDINLEALAKLKGNGYTNWHYTIVGDGGEKSQLVKMVKDYELNENVSFVGACPHEKVYEYLKEADVFVLPSYREAFGIVYLEAMASGLLTIGVYEQGAAEFITPGETGFLVKPQDSNDLYERLVEIFNSKDCFYEVASNGQKYVIQHLTWQSHARKVRALLQELVAGVE